MPRRSKNAPGRNSGTRSRITPKAIINKTRPSTIQEVKAPKRGTRNRVESLPPSKSILLESFSTKALRDRYAMVCERPILVGRSIHVETLETLGIRKEVDDLVSQIGWKSFFEIDCPAFIELTREFYTTFKFESPDNLTLDTPDVIKYRLMGESFSQSITEFNLSLGVIVEDDVSAEWYINSKVGYGNFIGCRVWRDLSTDTGNYDPSQSSSAYLKKPEWQYIHRFMSFNFVGRKSGSATCSKVELYFIWAMVNSVKVNLGYWLADQIKKVMEKKKGLILGSMITHLAISHGLLDLKKHSLHKAHDITPLNLISLERMRIIEKNDGIYTVKSVSRPMLTKETWTKDCVEKHGLPEDREAPDESIPTYTIIDVMQKLDQLAEDVSIMKSDMKAFFESHNFQPPRATS